MWEKEKWAISSFPMVFFNRELSAISIKFEIVIYKLWVWKSLKFVDLEKVNVMCYQKTKV